MNKSINELIGITNKILADYAVTKSYSETGRHFETSPTTIRTIVLRYGEFHSRRELSRIEQLKQALSRDEVVGAYVSCSRKQLAEKWGIPYNSVGHLLEYFGCYTEENYLARSQRKQASLGYKNPLESESWDKWYLVGYFLGDGCLFQHGGRMVANYTSSDKSAIEYFANLLGTQVRSGSVYSTETVYLPFIRDLQALGFCPRKSFVGMPLPSIPEGYFSAFSLGLLDSDGCVRVRGQSLIFEWFGHPSYMDGFYKLLLSLGFYGKIYLRSDSLASITLVLNRNPNLITWLYQDARFYLSRKYNRCMKYLAWDKQGKFIDTEYHNYV